MDRINEGSNSRKDGEGRVIVSDDEPAACENRARDLELVGCSAPMVAVDIKFNADLEPDAEDDDDDVDATGMEYGEKCKEEDLVEHLGAVE